jgi:class 3 adenylate cyclase
MSESPEDTRAPAQSCIDPVLASALEAESQGEAILVEPDVQREMGRTPVSLRDDLYSKGYHDSLALSIDLRGFSSFAKDTERDRVAAFLEKYSQELLAAVNGFSASYYKLLGDGALVIWDDADEHAVEACRDLFRLLREVVAEIAGQYGSSCALAGGLTYDSLYKYEIFGECSGLKYRDYIGYGINIAFRLQSMAKSGELLANPAVNLGFGLGAPLLPEERKPPRSAIKGLKDEDYDGIVVLESLGQD